MEAAPIRQVAEMLGADTDSERAIGWPIALMVLCCGPLAIALTAAISTAGGMNPTEEEPLTDNTRNLGLPPGPREAYRLTEEERAARARESAAAQQKP